MSVKVIDLGKKQNDTSQKKILQRHNEAQKHLVFPYPDTPTLYDKSEFPSLSESLGNSSSYLPSTGVSLKYSDKLKAPLSYKSQASVSDSVRHKCDTGVSDIRRRDIFRSKSQSIDNKNKFGDSSKQTTSKPISNHSLNNLSKKEFSKQKPVLKSKLNIQTTPTKSLTSSSEDANISLTSNKQPNKSVSVENNESPLKNTAAKKRKRKSKIKRQVALQSGKITFLTPEVHSKILNQATTLNIQNSVKRKVLGNINDEEEYPELGKVALPVNQKENFLKKNISAECQVEASDKSTDVTVEQNVIFENVAKEATVVTAPEKATEKKDKNEKVHSHNPITISFYDMLLEKNIKKKKEAEEVKIKAELPNVPGLSKLKNKKNLSHPHNLLDSSSPAIKRGKEREKPKPKKPSQLKKIILLDRKTRRENFLQMKNSSAEETFTNDNDVFSKSCEENNQLTEEEECQFSNFVNDLPALFEESEENIETLQLSETTHFSDQEDLISEMIQLNLSNQNNDCNIISGLSTNYEEIMPKDSFTEKMSSNLPLDEKSKVEELNNMASLVDNQSDTEMHLNDPHSPESLLNNFVTNLKFDTSDKEKAVKILLHTRNFREYCNHLISKDIDDATYALLDDLARFQDRLHQKDPVKARMKKRMIYGVKEVKKHIKLRKLKCIIIAVDIENVETQGGLNDILNEIKVSAVDHHIPCIFALSRKVLGKVCRKPVPVSCVGVFNFEGSEANFKNLVQLQTQSKADYTEIFNKLLLKITDEEVASLMKAKKEAPETLRDIRENILSDFFQLPDSVKSEDENVDLKSNDDMLDLFDNSV